MGDPGQSEWDPPISLRAKCREKIKKLQRDRVNGKGSAASSSVPRKRRSSGGACSRSCSSPKASEVEQAGSPQASIFGRRETSDTPLGATRVLDRGKSILIAVENHVGGGGGGGGECSYQAPETDSLEHPQNTRAVSQGHGHDKKKNNNKKANDAADTVATSSSTVPGNLFPTPGTGAAPAERTNRGIRDRRGKWEVEIRVAVAKQKLLGFERITLGVHDTFEQACVARNVGDFYCGKWPPACVISDPRILSSLLPLEKLDKLPPTEMKKQIQEIARCATLGCCTSRTHPGRGLINAAAAAPVQQEVEIKEGCSHFELDHVQQLDQAQGAAAAAAGVNNPSSDLDQICSEYLGPDTTQQDDFPNTQELQHLPQQRSSHGTAAAGDSQTLEAADQLEAAALQEAAATNHVNIMDEDDQHSGGSWDVENALNLNEEGRVPCADWLNDVFDQYPGLMWEINSGNLQSDMELDQLDWENNLPILPDSTIPHNNVSTIAHDNIQESEEYQVDEMEFQQFLEQYCDEMQYQQMQF